MSVAGWSGRLRVLGGRLFSASRAVQEKSKQFTHTLVNASPGRVTSQLMKSRQWMMMGNLFCLVLESAGNKIAVIRATLSDMKRGN